jgi:hypothetical protein
MRVIPARGATAPSDIPTIAPAPRRSVPAWAWVRAVLARELAAAALLLAIALAVTPGATRHQLLDQTVWDYQRDPISLTGAGPLNAYARGALQATGWLARTSIERQRDVARLNLLGFAVDAPAATTIGRWRQAHRAMLETGTAAAAVVLLAYGLLGRPATRAWLAALLLLLASTLAITQPHTTMRLAASPGAAVQVLTATTAVRTRLAATPADRTTLPAVQQTLAGRYWTAFVGRPLSRAQTGSPLLADTPPAGKAARRASLRRSFHGVDEWTRGRHTIERAAIATLAVAYALPVALALVVLAMAAACAQALLLLLCLATLVAAPLAVDGRWHATLVRCWLAPLAATAALLAAVTMASLLLLWLATAVRALDEQVGVVVGSAALPLLAAAVVAHRRHRRGGDAR